MDRIFTLLDFAKSLVRTAALARSVHFWERRIAKDLARGRFASASDASRLYESALAGLSRNQ